MAQLDADVIVPGHGPVLHNKAYLYLVRDLLNSAVEQLQARIRQIGHPGFHTVDDKDLQAEFDDMTTHLVKIAFNEAALR